MRLWEDEQPGQEKPASERDYETVGYVIKGRAELHLGPQIVLLDPGDSWVVARGASHSYRILQAFTALTNGDATTSMAIVPDDDTDYLGY